MSHIPVIMSISNISDIISHFKKSKVTDKHLSETHVKVMQYIKIKDLDDKYAIKQIEILYNLFISNYIVLTREILMDILPYIFIRFESVSENIKLVDYIDRRFSKHDLYTIEDMEKIKHLIKTEDEMLKYLVIYASAKKSSPKIFRKLRSEFSVTLTSDSFIEYVKRTTTVSLAVIAEFAKDKVVPDAETVVRIANKVKGLKTFNSCMLLMFPHFKLNPQ